MISSYLIENRKKYLAYNSFRKEILAAFAPKDGETLLYLLPWMLNENMLNIPGYVPDLKHPIQVRGLVHDKDIAKREAAFLNQFQVNRSRAPRRFAPSPWVIEGLYTIGSIGSIGQTSRSDCDLWICVDRERFGDKGMDQLQAKLNLIKDWLDANCRIPVYFFVSDVEDVRQCRFGVVTHEGSGSTQRHVLKEEFYRTMVILAGRIPLWWLAVDPSGKANYANFAEALRKGVIGEEEYLDLGDLTAIEQSEYLGAAFWQFNKALTHPMKSIMKMLLLRMFIETPEGDLLCHRFRNRVLSSSGTADMMDPTTYTMTSVLDFHRDRSPDDYDTIRQCFYLRCDMKLHSRKAGRRESLAAKLFESHPVDRETAIRLNDFANWSIRDQLQIGNRALAVLLKIYRDISAPRKEAAESIRAEDLTIIGRKLSSCLERKPDKIPVIHKPVEILNQPTLVFRIQDKLWQAAPADHPESVLVESPSIVYCIAYLVWNGLFTPGLIRMLPNSTSVTLQEITSLGKRIQDIFGAHDVTAIDFKNFQDSERAVHLLAVVNFGGTFMNKEMNDIAVLHDNNWGELFYARFSSPEMFQKAFRSQGRKYRGMLVQYYVQRNNFYYDKIIERTKRTVMSLFLA